MWTESRDHWTAWTGNIHWASCLPNKSSWEIINEGKRGKKRKREKNQNSQKLRPGCPSDTSEAFMGALSGFDGSFAHFLSVCFSLTPSTPPHSDPYPTLPLSSSPLAHPYLANYIPLATADVKRLLAFCAVFHSENDPMPCPLGRCWPRNSRHKLKKTAQRKSFK